MNQKHFFTLFFLCLFLFSSGQEKKTETDSTSLTYKRIENYSKKNNFTKFLHKLVFKTTKVTPIKPKSVKIPEKNHTLYEGKIIRNINIQTLDPFGYSEKDTAKKPKRFTEKAANSIHVKSKKFAIRNIVLIKRNKPYDSLMIKETERLIRSQRFIRRVDISSELVSAQSDSVDINITVLDSWSLIPNASLSSSRGSYELTERNFLGTGHLWDNRFQHDLDDKRNAFSTRYVIPNIRNSYVQTAFNYQIDLDNNYAKSIEMERRFFSPYTRWAGGVFLENRLRRDSLPDFSQEYKLQTFKFNMIDIWGGHSFDITRENNVNERSTNFVTTLRYLKINYLEDITSDFDPIDFYTNESFWLSGIGISSRKFVQEKFVFNYDIVEDIPIGKYYGVTIGNQLKNFDNRWYVGARATFGNYFKWGYLSTNYEYGTFFRDKKNEQSAFVAQINYFTPLMEFGRWKLRQFFKSDIILGGHRLDIQGDKISINESNGISGFNDPKFLGTKKMIFSFQTQSYSPWDWAGFRFSPFFNFSMAFLGNTEYDFQKSKGYAKLGMGVLITNDYLVFNSFQISFAYYPSIPNDGENLFKSNTFKTDDFGYLDFEINKPRVVLYQ
ncbi:MAG TPA: hypothetical protein PLL09_10155 [Flavobacterium sp.]|uniref:hypothetical protein n=1 Tax=unclassified Flavobacterium TaxID=196869 RepID=UPI0025C0B28C|nr:MULTISPECIES: hypothetical protein [unclassified Flavobacterium]HRE78173.1 hypothetical protein [Flavobacterium sp.]